MSFMVKLDNGGIIKLGRGFDINHKPNNWYSIGRARTSTSAPCPETMVAIYRTG